MTNEVPVGTRQQLVASTFPGWTAGAWRVLAVNNTYTFSATHANLSDITAGVRIGNVVLGTKTTDGFGRASAANPAVIACASGVTVKGLWVYLAGASEAVSTLLSWHDTSADGTPLLATTEDATGISVQWTAGLGVWAIL